MDKNQELYLFTKFRSLLPDLTDGNFIHDDRPDFIFTTLKGESVGIEITECIYSQSLMQESQFRIDFISELIEKAEKIVPFKFHLSVDLDKTNPIKKGHRIDVINRLLELFNEELQNIAQYQTIELVNLQVDWDSSPIELQKLFFDKGFRKLPLGINSIRVTRLDQLSKSTHFEFKSGEVPIFTFQHLDQILRRKEDALLNYKKCDYQWLLITEGGDFYSYYSDIRIDTPITTNFDKTFLLRRWGDTLITLK